MDCNTLGAFAANHAIFTFECVTFGWQVALPRKRMAFLFSFFIFELNMLNHSSIAVHDLQESHRDNIICNTNSINTQFNDELEKWRRKNGPTKDVNKEFNDELEKWRRKYGPTKDVNKEFKDLLKDMSRKQDEGLMKEKSIIKLKRNYSQEREIRETVTYTAEENKVPEPDTAKESSVNKIHELLENIPLKV
jgi:hypothetical protein